jgi:hypothetical protein
MQRGFLTNSTIFFIKVEKFKFDENLNNPQSTNIGRTKSHFDMVTASVTNWRAA